MDKKITLLAVVQNEEQDLPGLLENCRWVDDIIVVDGGSRDRTVQIAREAGARVFERTFDNFSAQRQFGLDQVNTEWVLWLDADERMDDLLKREMQIIVKGESKLSAYTVLIRSRFWNRYLDHVWKPIHLTRLFRKGQCRFSGKAVHESVVCSGATGLVANGWISHDTYRTVAEHLAKINQYTELLLEDDVAEWHRRGIKPYMLIKYPLISFVERYLIKGGWKDGFPGFVMCVQVAYLSFIRMTKAYESIKGYVP